MGIAINGITLNAGGKAVIAGKSAAGMAVGGHVVYKYPAADTEILPTGITIDQGGTPSVDKGKTLQLTATVTPGNATDKTVTWKSTSATIATINAAGLVTGKGLGTAMITATTVNGITAGATLTVK